MRANLPFRRDDLHMELQPRRKGTLKYFKILKSNKILKIYRLGNFSLVLVLILLTDWFSSRFYVKIDQLVRRICHCCYFCFISR